MSSGASGKHGGTFGCTRKGDDDCVDTPYDKNHDGIDIKATVGTPLYATHSGRISSIRDSFEPGEYKKDSYGNYITLTTQIDGNTYHIKFNHLNSLNVTVNQNVEVGDLIGYSGITGNAASPGVTPHIHMQVYNSNWSDKEDPMNFISTEFDENYEPIESTNCN